jgi:8-oxo-dGTP diphosphatase
MPAIDRIDVWLGVAGVLKKDDIYLVVKKKYGGLRDKWSFPAGFVDPGETIDQAIIREVLEETGVRCRVRDILGIRTGVIKEKISDNMIIFQLEYQSGNVVTNTEELVEAGWLTKEQLLNDQATSSMIRFFLLQEAGNNKRFGEHSGDPGREFGYTEYKIYS